MFKKSVQVMLLMSPMVTTVLANPFQPETYTPKTNATSAPVIIQQPLPRLHSIVIIGSQRSALFAGGYEVAIGDEINGYRLIDIQNNSVVLSQSQRQYLLAIDDGSSLNISPTQEGQ